LRPGSRVEVAALRRIVLFWQIDQHALPGGLSKGLGVGKWSAWRSQERDVETGEARERFLPAKLRPVFLKQLTRRGAGEARPIFLAFKNRAAIFSGVQISDPWGIDLGTF